MVTDLQLTLMKTIKKLLVLWITSVSGVKALNSHLFSTVICTTEILLKANKGKKIHKKCVFLVKVKSDFQTQLSENKTTTTNIDITSVDLGQTLVYARTPYM